MSFNIKALAALFVLVTGLTTAFCSQNCTLDKKHDSVNCRGLGLTAIPDLPTWTRSVDLSRNKITIIYNLTLKNLEIINLSNNKISKVEKTAFFKCPSLKTIDLSYNHLKGVPTLTLPNVTVLTSLNLASNDLQIIMSNTFEFLSTAPLAALNLSRTLKRTSASPIDVKSLEPLAKYLRVLDLSYNKLKAESISKGLKPLQNSKLEELLISGSFLQSLGDILVKLPTLSKLSVKDSDLTSLEAGTFKGVSKTLVQLDLRSNSLKSFSAEVFESLKLKEAFLSNNPFDCTCDLAWMPSWLKNNPVMDKANVKCATPEKLKETEILNWNADGCITTTPPDTTTTTETPSNLTTTEIPSNVTTTETPSNVTTTETPSNLTTTEIPSNVSTTPTPVSTTAHPQSTLKPGNGGHKGFPWWGALLIVIAITLVGIGLYVIVRRTRRRQQLDDSLTPIVGDDEEVTTRRFVFC